MHLKIAGLVALCGLALTTGCAQREPRNHAPTVAQPAEVQGAALGETTVVKGHTIRTVKIGKCWYILTAGANITVEPLMEPEKAYGYGGTWGTERQVCDRG